MGGSQNEGPILVRDYIATADILGVSKWDPNFGNYPCLSSVLTTQLAEAVGRFLIYCSALGTRVPRLMFLGSFALNGLRRRSHTPFFQHGGALGDPWTNWDDEGNTNP